MKRIENDNYDKKKKIKHVPLNFSGEFQQLTNNALLLGGHVIVIDEDDQ